MVLDHLFFLTFPDSLGASQLIFDRVYLVLHVRPYLLLGGLYLGFMLLF
jgi:hypothetical protein